MLSYDELYALVRKTLSPKRALHVLGVEREAVTLAMRWGVDVGDARRAALLHDITKEVDDQLKLCAEYGIMADKWSLANSKLFHAQTGAEKARSLGENENVALAIRWHTTGRPDMTALQKVIYLADFVEPSRKKPNWLAELRRLVYEDLDRAMLKGLEMSLEDLLDRGLEIHPNSWEARSWYLEKSGAPASEEKSKEQ